MVNSPSCRCCGTTLVNTFVNLGMSPLSNSYLSHDQLQQAETYYPLHAYVCSQCYLVQLDEFQAPENIFSDYAYFSSYSTSWLKHAENYCNMASKRFSLGIKSSVVEIASNDGYLLQYFANKNIPVLGIEPAKNVAKIAMEKGIPTISKFFNMATANELVSTNGKADLIIANNVLAHVPDINSLVEGLSILLDEKGSITIEFPHLLELIKGNQFDTIYHEHFSYLSLTSAIRVFEKHELSIYDVEQLNSHGGSLRIYIKHKSNDKISPSINVENLLKLEFDFGLTSLDSYEKFGDQAAKVKRDLLSFLIKAKEEGKSVVGYGAPAKGNTLLNYCGIGPDLIDFTVDKNPHKQDKYLPGSLIPVFSPDQIKLKKPDFLLILPWNLKTEIIEETDYIGEWGGQHVIPIPSIELSK